MKNRRDFLLITLATVVGNISSSALESVYYEFFGRRKPAIIQIRGDAKVTATGNASVSVVRPVTV